MTAHTTDTGLKSLHELRTIEAHIVNRIAHLSASLASTRYAITMRTSFPKPCAATEQQAARLASFGLMPPTLVNPIGCNVERGAA